MKAFKLSDKIFLRYKNLSLSYALKCALSGLRKFLTTESSLKIMKNTFYFILKALFVLKVFKFVFRLFGHVEKRLDKKARVNLKIYYVTTWKTNNYTYCPRSQEVKENFVM